ncbi:MAG TPA: FAD-dependent oxidoreductase, partial [Mycobacterium sp.]|nr:FAD-dependent oxidoreductase [Mycobacterium sp.]
MTGVPRHPALRDAAPAVFWLDDPRAPQPEPRLESRIECDLAIVGAGFTGLWSALLARRRNPALDIVVLEARRSAAAASGRNGGFCDASLTHGFANGVSRFSAEIDTLDRLGLQNLDAIESTVREHDIDCDFERTGMLDMATASWQYAELVEAAEAMRAHGYRVDTLDADAVR